VSTITTDVDLLTRAVGGDREARNELATSCYRVIRNVCRRYTGNDALAEEAMQETMTKLMNGLPTFDLSRNFRRWLLAIAVNASRDVLRLERRQSPVIETIDAEEVRSPTPSVELVLVERQEREERNERIKACDVDGQVWAQSHITRDQHRNVIVDRLANKPWTEISSTYGYSSADSAQKSITKAVRHILKKSPTAYDDARVWVDRCRQRTGRQRVKFLDLVDLDTVYSSAGA
jgi:RNA polymerase sigma factor (sigma-70 family)